MGAGGGGRGDVQRWETGGGGVLTCKGQRGLCNAQDATQAVHDAKCGLCTMQTAGCATCRVQCRLCTMQTASCA